MKTTSSCNDRCWACGEHITTGGCGCPIILENSGSGWVCPKCGRYYNIDVDYCYCSNDLFKGNYYGN